MGWREYLGQSEEAGLDGALKESLAHCELRLLARTFSCNIFKAGGRVVLFPVS